MTSQNMKQPLCHRPMEVNSVPQNSLKFKPEQNKSGSRSSLLKKLDQSMRIITCNVEGIHHWISTLGDKAPIVFELFGNVKEIIPDHQKIMFTVGGKSLEINCIFYCMEQIFPFITKGECIRAIGRLDTKTNNFQCISVRQATTDEKSCAMKLVQMCVSTVNKFHLSKHEV
ncbi:SPATA22 [Bugula neritina]|uniref:SPATA22 n=1 Tax=Bugula neritina TaxID=10212 RepID=A0A7J7J7L9_BUGNE|nr:SPATA22 [Bugula neritina]